MKNIFYTPNLTIMKNSWIVLYFALVTASCTREKGSVDVTIHNDSYEEIAVQLTNKGWRIIPVNQTIDFIDYNTNVLENTNLNAFTAQESPEAFARILDYLRYHGNYSGGCPDDIALPPYGGGVEQFKYDFRRSRKVGLDGEENTPLIRIVAEPIDSLVSGATDRDIQKINFRILN
jgi:hypothetical protein